MSEAVAVAGPFTPKEIAIKVRSGAINDQTMLCPEGSQEWAPLPLIEETELLREIEKKAFYFKLNFTIAVIVFIVAGIIIASTPDTPSSSKEWDKNEAAKKWLSHPSNREAYQEYNKNR